MRVGVTGHRDLTADAEQVVARALKDLLADIREETTELVGVSCLARGADSIFAELVIDLGGKLEVVLPSADYRSAVVDRDHRRQFETLLSKAELVRVLPFERATADAYVAANVAVLKSIDRLVAVWDGLPSAGAGGTGDAVICAQSAGLPVTVIWPAGAARR